MTAGKQNGLGDQLYLHGVNASGRIGSISGIGSPFAPLVVSDITQSAPERLAGLGDGGFSFASWFDSTHAIFDQLSALPRTDVVATYFRGSEVGAVAASVVAKQIGFDPNRTADGGLSLNTAVTGSAGAPLEWGLQATAGSDDFTGTGDGTALIIPGQTSLVQDDGTHGVASTPDAASLDIVGDIDIRARVAANDWTPAAASYLVAKYTTTADQRSYALSLSTAGELVLQWTTDGTAGTLLTKTSTANLSSLAAGALKWVRATLDVNNGAAGNTVNF